MNNLEQHLKEIHDYFTEALSDDLKYTDIIYSNAGISVYKVIFCPNDYIETTIKFSKTGITQLTSIDYSAIPPHTLYRLRNYRLLIRDIQTLEDYHKPTSDEQDIVRKLKGERITSVNTPVLITSIHKQLLEVRKHYQKDNA